MMRKESCLQGAIKESFMTAVGHTLTPTQRIHKPQTHRNHHKEFSSREKTVLLYFHTFMRTSPLERGACDRNIL